METEDWTNWLIVVLPWFAVIAWSTFRTVKGQHLKENRSSQDDAGQDMIPPPFFACFARSVLSLLWLQVSIGLTIAVIMVLASARPAKGETPIRETPPPKWEQQPVSPRGEPAYWTVPGKYGIAMASKPVDPVTGREARCDLPPDFHLRNIRGRNGQGCCVYASSEMMAEWHAFKPLAGVLKEGLGGANDSDVRRMFARKAPGFSNYVQATGRPSIDLIEWGMRTRRLMCVTWSESHMVCCLHLDPATEGTPRACILDNNNPGQWAWMSRAEFLRQHQVGGAWSFCLILPPPPPIPLFPKAVK